MINGKYLFIMCLFIIYSSFYWLTTPLFGPLAQVLADDDSGVTKGRRQEGGWSGPPWWHHPGGDTLMKINIFCGWI